jgi:hypothetical protein
VKALTWLEETGAKPASLRTASPCGDAATRFRRRRRGSAKPSRSAKPATRNASRRSLISPAPAVHYAPPARLLRRTARRRKLRPPLLPHRRHASRTAATPTAPFTEADTEERAHLRDTSLATPRQLTVSSAAHQPRDLARQTYQAPRSSPASPLRPSAPSSRKSSVLR